MSIRSLCRLAPLTRSTASSCVSCRSTRWPVPSTHARRVHVLHTISEVRQARLEMSASSPSSPLTLGFVPTMGALHSGHIDLVRASQKDNHKTLVSIFVNPTQFLPGEDLAAYPRPLARDLELLTSANVDYAFVPQPHDMYSTAPLPPHSTFVDQLHIDHTPEGRARPTHFRGVATVCTKLFNIVQPDVAYFGAKDGLQCIVITRLVRELNIPVKVRVVDTAREEDGLAKSSRNVYLTAEDRAVAGVLYRALREGQRVWGEGEVDVEVLKGVVRGLMEREGQGKVDVQYVSIASVLSGEEMTGRLGERQAGRGRDVGAEVADNLPYSRVMLSVAAKIGRTRLIDNVILGPKVREMTEYE